MEMTTIKTVAVFAIIFGCFAVLYPKIFHPMMGQLFGLGPRQEPQDIATNRMPPHLRKPGESGKTVQQDDDISRFMARAGPHPGMRAAAEMKKQAATQTGSNKGMMAIVLPMYAVGIVIYLIYTMIKVFGGKSKDEKGGDFLKSHFSDIQYDADKKKFLTVNRGEEEEEAQDESDISNRFKKGRRELERLLLKADKNNINAYEMHELRNRLLETEAQMARILGALEAVETQVGSVSEGQEPVAEGDGDGEWVDEGQAGDAQQTDGQQASVKEEDHVDKEDVPANQTLIDSSPDMDCYEIIRGKSAETTPDSPSDAVRTPSMEDLGTELDVRGAGDSAGIGASGPSDAVVDNTPQSHAKCRVGDDFEVEPREEVIGGDGDGDLIDNEKHPDLRKRLLIQSKQEE